MTDQVGTLLWEMRTTSGWTLGRLAQQAGVSKMALSRWEAGTRQPRIPELEAVLKVLNASSSQRAAVLSCLKAPRAVQHLRTITTKAGLGELPAQGDMLRALRLRKGLTQTQTARAMDVTQATIARWEAGDRLPDTIQIQTLCYVLEAREEELIALTTGHFSEASEYEPKTWHAAQEDIQATLQAALAQDTAIPADLFYLSLERKAMRWAMQEEAARPLLGQIYGWHAQFLRNVGRVTEVAAVAQKGLKLASPKDPEVFLRSVVLAATGIVHDANHIAPQRGIRLLRDWLERTSLPDFKAWMLSDLATYMKMMGETGESIFFLSEACVIAKQSSNPMELFLRRCDLGTALLEAKRPCEALRVLPPPITSYPRENAQALLLWSDAHHQDENLSEAHNALNQAQQLITEHNLTALRPRAEACSRRF